MSHLRRRLIVIAAVLILIVALLNPLGMEVGR